MGSAIKEASLLLRGRTELFCGDFTETMKGASKGDLVYLDPPYHGTTYGKDKRYFTQLERDALIAGLADLNARDVPFLLSYDGMTGGIEYGEPLPDDLGMRRLLLDAGRSSQATLNGRNEVTLESLYVSPGLIGNIKADPEPPLIQESLIFESAGTHQAHASLEPAL